MLGFSGLKIAAFALAALAITAIVGGFWLHYRGLVADNAQLVANQAQLETALDQSKQATDAAMGAIADWQEAAAAYQAKVDELAAVEHAASERMGELNALFARHDLDRLASAKPGLVEVRVNRGTAAALGLLECLSAGREDCAARDPEAPRGASAP